MVETDPFPDDPDPHIAMALVEVPKIMNEPVFGVNGHPLQRSVVARVVTILGECLKRSANINGVVCSLSAEGIDPNSKGDGSLSALLERARNANAHVFSELRNLAGSYISFATYDSRLENAIVVDDEAFSLGFDDDFTLAWGQLQLTLRGDILPAYEWLRLRYNPELPSMTMHKGPLPK